METQTFISSSDSSDSLVSSESSTKPPLWKQFVGMVMGMVIALTLYSLYKDGSEVVSAYLIKTPETKTEVIIERKEAVQAAQKKKRSMTVELQPLL